MLLDIDKENVKGIYVYIDLDVVNILGLTHISFVYKSWSNIWNKMNSSPLSQKLTKN